MVSYPQRLDAESLSEIPAMQMHVLGGILRAKVFADGQYGDEKVQSIAFADENTPMAGAFKLDLTGLSDEASLIVTGLASRTAKTQVSHSLRRPVVAGERQRHLHDTRSGHLRRDPSP